ncbi:hypothetical protein RHGRI_034196 [Rhododendron griersonianum]|uniref:Uncharacterized protein n=1 Tax=Rhododendron griersonianum TaxID=479676 RepID=A0AAV6I2J3_9ERIC|nr:hypothetical protein RHGRI_034196 [Rhododendron griersonianum]
MYDGNLRAEISWLDTINFGDKEPTKLVYPVSKKEPQRQRRWWCGVFSSRGQNWTRVVKEASEESFGLQMSSSDVGSVGNRTKDVGLLSADVGSPQELIHPDAIQVSLSPKSAKSKESPPLKKSNLAIRDVDSALIALPPSTLVISPPNFSPAKPNSSKSSKGRYVKGGEGIRRSPRRKGVPLSRPSHLRRVEVNVAQEIDYPSDRVNRDIECEEALFDDDSQSGIVSRASVAGPNQPRVQW